MLEKGSVLSLNNGKEYLIVYSAIINSKKYVFLINQDDYMDNMICEYDNASGLNEVKDPKIVEQFLLKFDSEINI